MDRLMRSLAGCGLALLVTTAGCHNLRDQVPPSARKFRNDGKVDAAKVDSSVEFSTKPHDLPGFATGPVGGAPGNMAPNNALSSTGSPGNAYGNLTTDNKFGAPGSAGLGQAPSLMNGPAPAASYPPQPAPRASAPPSDSGAGNPF